MIYILIIYGRNTLVQEAVEDYYYYKTRKCLDGALLLGKDHN